MCLRHLPTQSNFHLVQHRSFHATPGIFHPKREESANRYENGAEHCIVLGWFFERQNSQVIAPHVGSFDVLMPSPSPQFFALTVVPKSKYPENDVILRKRVGKKYFSDQNIWLRLSFAPACPRFQNAQRFIFKGKIGQVTGQNLFFFPDFLASNRLFRGRKQVSHCLVRNFVSNTIDGYGIQAYHPNGVNNGPWTVGLKVMAICDRFPASFVCKMSFGSRSITLYTYILVHTCDTGQTRGKKPLGSVSVLLRRGARTRPNSNALARRLVECVFRVNSLSLKVQY